MRLARIMLAVQVPTLVLAGGLLFWRLGLPAHSHHHIAVAAIVTAGYAALSIAFIAWMQWSLRSRARRLAQSQPDSAG